MAALSTIQLRGYFSGLLGGSRSISPTDLVNVSAPALASSTTLANGDTTIAGPTGSIGCIILLNPASVTVKKLKGIVGDTGVAISKVGWLVLSFDPTIQPLIIINSSAADTGLTTEFIFF